MKYKHELILLGLCCFMITMMWHYNMPNLTFDDANYIKYAGQMVLHSFNVLQSPYSYGYIYPLTIAISYQLLGISLFASALPTMLEYIALILLTYYTIRKLISPSIAFYTSFLLATSAFVVAYSTRALPDMLIGLLIAGAIYMLTEPKHNRAFTAGLLIGIIIFVKLGALIVVPPVIVAMFFYSKKSKLGYFVLGLAIMLVIYFASIGFNLSILSSYSANQVKLDQTTLLPNIEEMVYYMPIGYTFLSNPEAIQLFPLGFLFLFGLIGGLIAIKNKDRRLMAINLILWLTYFYLFLGTESIHSYSLITVVSRYFIWIATPMAILAGYFLSESFKWLQYTFKTRTALTYIMLLVVICLVSNLPMLAMFSLHKYSFNGAPI